MIKWLLFIIGFSILSAHGGDLVQANNLLLDSQLARKQKTPILILFSEHSCPYCEIAKEEVLIPISKLKSYKNKVIIREVVVGNDNKFYDFYNNPTDGDDFRFKYSVNFYPTIIFVDYYGNRIMPDIIGIIDTEFYWQKIDKSLNVSNIKINKKITARL